MTSSRELARSIVSSGEASPSGGRQSKGGPMTLLQAGPRRLGVALLAALFIPQTAQPQTLYGSIVGNLKDSTGAVITGANVTITHNETKQARETVTNTSGGYDFATVPTGSYTVKVSQPGFKTLTRSHVLVTLNAVTRVDLVASVGDLSESVSVTAEPAPLKTDRAEV